MLLMSNSSFFLDEDQRNNPDWQSRVSQSLFLIFIFTSEKRQVASQRQSSTNAKVWLSLKIRRYVMDPISGVNNTIPDKAGILYTYMARNSKTVMFKVILSPVHTFLISFHFLKWPSFSVLILFLLQRCGDYISQKYMLSVYFLNVLGIFSLSDSCG